HKRPLRLAGAYSADRGRVPQDRNPGMAATALGTAIYCLLRSGEKVSGEWSQAKLLTFNPAIGDLQFAFCNLHFAICNSCYNIAKCKLILLLTHEELTVMASPPIGCCGITRRGFLVGAGAGLAAGASL